MTPHSTSSQPNSTYVSLYPRSSPAGGRSYQYCLIVRETPQSPNQDHGWTTETMPFGFVTTEFVQLHIVHTYSRFCAGAVQPSVAVRR